jgi:hypothetical protein
MKKSKNRALSNQPKTHNRKMMIEGACKPNSFALHDREAGGIDCRQLV